MRRAMLLTSLCAGLLAGTAGHAVLAASKTRPAAAEQGEARMQAEVATPEARRLAAQDRLGFGLIAEIARDAKAPVNIIVSPASLAAPLALLDLGASPPMQAAIHKTLGFSGKGGKPAADLEALRQALAPLAGPIASGPLAFAGAVVFDPSVKPFPAALEKLKAAGAEVSVESLDDPATRDRLNSLVAEKTRGLIPTLLEQPLTGAGLVALNALHFKDDWKAPFDAKATQPAPFVTADGGTATVPTMHAADAVRLRQDGHFVAIDLPYATPGYSLVVLTTKDKPGKPDAFGPAAAWLSGEGFAETQADLALPRFSLAGSFDLLDVADKLGLKPARAAKAALGGLSPVPQPIARIVQKTVIGVDEKGTEAAAATAVTTLRSLPPRRVAVKIDKPFLFALRQADTGLVLVMGYVGNPEAAAKP